MIYKIFDLYPQFLACSSQNPWNFLRVRSDQGIFYYVNESDFGPHPRVTGRSTMCLELSVFPTFQFLPPPGRKEGLVIE